MKTISQHLGQIILAVAAVALIIGVVLTFGSPVHNFMDGVMDKLYEVGNGPIWNVGGTTTNPDEGGSGAGGTGDEDSVLGLRKLKADYTPFTEYTPNSNEELFNSYGFTFTEQYGNNGATVIFEADDGSRALVGKTTEDICYLYSSGESYFTTIVEYWINTGLEILSTTNSTVDEWLLANTEPVEEEETYVIGVTGLDNSAGVLTLTDSASGVEAYSLTTSGDYVSVTNDLDNYFPFNQIEEFTDEYGNVFVKYPQLWMKWETNSDGEITGYKFSNTQVDEDYFIPDAFLDPRSVGGEDVYLDYFALGKYEMTGTAEQGTSTSGAACLVNVTRAQARAAAQSYGTAANYYNGYQQLDFAQWTAYNLLCMMYYQTTNIQSVYAGCSEYDWSDGAQATGTTDGVNGLNGWNTASTCVKMLGIENPYGNVYQWVDGFYTHEGTIYAQRYAHLYSDSIENATALGFLPPADNAYLTTAFKHGTSDATKSYMFASNGVLLESEDQFNQYCGDPFYVSSTDDCVLFVGGSWSNGSICGLWCAVAVVPSGYGSDAGARLSYRPL